MTVAEKNASGHHDMDYLVLKCADIFKGEPVNSAPPPGLSLSQLINKAKFQQRTKYHLITERTSEKTCLFL